MQFVFSAVRGLELRITHVRSDIVIASLFMCIHLACSCIYHYGELRFVRENKYVLTCCQVPVRSKGMVWRVPGCTKGWHCPKQHTDYTYVGYYLYMNTLVSTLVGAKLTQAYPVDPVML